MSPEYGIERASDPNFQRLNEDLTFKTAALGFSIIAAAILAALATASSWNYLAAALQAVIRFGALGKLACVLVMLFAAYGLYALKCKWRQFYGAIELGFASVSAWKALGGWDAHLGQALKVWPSSVLPTLWHEVLKTP